MSEPDEAMVEAVAVEAYADDAFGWFGFTDAERDERRRLIRAALSVPVVRDALARDAQVREIVARNGDLFESLRDIAAMYPVAATAARLVATPGDGWGVWGEDDIPARLISEEQK